MEQIVEELVQVNQSEEVVNYYIVVLESTVVAGEGNRIHSLNHALHCAAHLVIELELELRDNQLDTRVEA